MYAPSLAQRAPLADSVTYLSTPGSDTRPEPSPPEIVPPPSEQPLAITPAPSAVPSGGFLRSGSHRALTGRNDNHLWRDMSDYYSTIGPSSKTTHTIDGKRLAPGLQIIDFILEHSVLLQNLTLHIHGVIRMPMVPPKVMLPAAEQLFTSLRNEVPPNDNNAKLRIVARIFQNSSQPILDHATKDTTVEQVCHAIIGENLRWETIGNVLAMASLCLIHIHDRDFSLLDPARRNKQDLVEPFHRITDTLMQLTSMTPVANELGVCLKYNQLLLALYRFGDSSQDLYAVFMELTSSIYATGMHHDSPNSSSRPKEYPGFMHQWRRRCFTAVYSMDKTIATTLGRPPLIHRNYCALDAPLDFDDDDLTGPELERELLKLDEHGWNTDGRLRSTTFVRIKYLLATVREQVLELHLGVNKDRASTPGRSQLVLQELRSIWNSCPDNVKYSPAIWNQSLDPYDIWFILRFYLDYLYSIFLIFRFNARQDQSQETMQLLSFAAKDVLSTVLSLNEHRELMREVRSDFSAVFLQFGLPCADFLAGELLYRPSSFSLGRSPVPNSQPRMIRSEVIRELTVYVSCLSWMPGKGGSSCEFSRQVQGRLTQVLDQIIDAPVSDNNTVLAEVRDPNGPFDPWPVNLNHLFFDWDATLYSDSQLDWFSQSLM